MLASWCDRGIAVSIPVLESASHRGGMPACFYPPRRYRRTMSRSIVEQVSFMVAVVIAAPVALAGVDMTLRGETTWGPVLISFAAIVLVVEKYVTTPHDVPGVAVAKAVGLVAKDPEDDADRADAES
jgi:peptidoglycan/LPS O-acetylase OafA/YrhL